VRHAPASRPWRELAAVPGLHVAGHSGYGRVSSFPHLYENLGPMNPGEPVWHHPSRTAPFPIGVTSHRAAHVPAVASSLLSWQERYL
jgi:hypothetical protein